MCAIFVARLPDIFVLIIIIIIIGLLYWKIVTSNVRISQSKLKTLKAALQRP